MVNDRAPPSARPAETADFFLLQHFFGQLPVLAVRIARVTAHHRFPSRGERSDIRSAS
jgi:hypothetical protein